MYLVLKQKWQWSLLLLCLSFCFFTSCAKEQSQEEHDQENRNRKVARLKRAEGTFSGVLNLADRGVVPVSLQITVQLQAKPGGTGAMPGGGGGTSSTEQNEPQLLGALRMGLFGGVIVTSTSSSFDWSDGQLTFDFVSKTGSSLEIRATVVKEGELQKAVLQGGQLGVFPLQLAKGDTNLFSSAREFSYQWVSPESREADGLLRMERLTDNQVPPAGSDMPALPGIRASVLFQGLASTPQFADQVLYDPLKGTLQLIYNGRSKVEAQGVFAKSDKVLSPELPAEPRQLQATIYAGAKNLGQAGLTLDDQSIVKKGLEGFPPPSFTGTYQGVGMTFHAVAYFDRPGTAGTNTLQFPFPSFPAVQFQIGLCTDGSVRQRFSYLAYSFDQMKKQTTFRPLVIAGGNEDEVLYLNYNSDWSSIAGLITAKEGMRPTFTMWAHAIGAVECAE